MTPSFLPDCVIERTNDEIEKLQKNKRRTSACARPTHGSVTFKRVLVPTDFSAESLKAVHFATEFAKQFGASLRLLHVVEPPSVLAQEKSN